MIQELTIRYREKDICLQNISVSGECLVFVNPDWEIMIDLRDGYGFRLRMEHNEKIKDIINCIFSYSCFCLVEKKSVCILKVHDQQIKAGIDPEIPEFIKPIIDRVFVQLKTELLYPFCDADYMQTFISKLK